MDDNNPTIKKLKGKLKQAQGKVQEMAGDEVGGKINQIQGKAEEEIANLYESRVSRNKRTSQDLEEKDRLAKEKELQDEANARGEDFEDDY